MWSTAGKVPAVGQVDINHFVPLVKIQSASCGVAPAVMQVDDTDEHAAATVDDSQLNELDVHVIAAGLAVSVIY